MNFDAGTGTFSTSETQRVAEKHVVYQTDLLTALLAEAKASRQLLQVLLFVQFIVGIPLLIFCIMFIAENAS